MSHYLFSYGTLQQERVQINLYGRVLNGMPDSLPGYKLMGIKVTDEIFLLKGEQQWQNTLVHTGNTLDEVTGTVFSLTDAELLSTDQYEPAGYHRISVLLASGKTAWIYIAD
jgi:gamma-glutamylcyclotransferase (GGCT)/AIG2-like uncharacterized protein YtfP